MRFLIFYLLVAVLVILFFNRRETGLWYWEPSLFKDQEIDGVRQLSRGKYVIKLEGQFWKLYVDGERTKIMTPYSRHQNTSDAIRAIFTKRRKDY